MKFTHGKSDNTFYNEEEAAAADDDDEEGAEIHERNCTTGSEATRFHPFLPITPSSAVDLNRLSASQPSTSAAPAPPPPAVEKEQMFEKVVTPSDVGKLNRLVIPKQHAEKYFPLDAATHDRGLILNFEDRNGKPWRFRYSYWNSSQSYVMTKGWSRFVKEKRLDAGDTVSFGRGAGETASHRLFIDWRRRPEPHLNSVNTLRVPRFPYQQYSTGSPSSGHHPHPYQSFARSAAAPWVANRLFVPHAPPPAPAASPASDYVYFRSSSAVAGQPTPPVPMVLDSIPVAHGQEAAQPKRVRLFGVNIEQPHETSDSAVATGLLGLKLRSPPFPSQDLRLAGGESSSAASSSSSAKDSHHSPPFDLDLF